MGGFTALAHGFPENKKVMTLHDRAFRFHITALDYCGRNLTDGHVSARGVKVVAAILDTAAKRWSKELVAAGLWRHDEAGDGFWINDYLIYNPSADAMKALSDKRRAAGVRGAEEKWRRERINRGMREALAERLGVNAGEVRVSACHYCGTPITVDWSDSKRVKFLDAEGRSTPEIDHVEPLAQGGSHEVGNLVLACLACNRSKGSRSLANASGKCQSKRQSKEQIPAEQSSSSTEVQDLPSRQFPDGGVLDEPNGLPIENQLLTVRLLQRIGDHADPGTGNVIRAYATGLPPASLAKVIESLELQGGRVRNRAEYAVAALKHELDGRGANAA